MAEAKVIIKAEDNITKAVNSAKNSLSSLEGAAVKMGSVLKNALGFTAVVASVKQLGDALYGCFSDFEEADRKYRHLEIALGGCEASSRAKDTIADLSRQPLEGKDSIKTMVSELAALGKSSDDIERISKAAVYLSNVTGCDLDLICAILNRISGFAVSDLKIREHVFPDGYRFAVLIHKGVYPLFRWYRRCYLNPVQIIFSPQDIV